MPNSCWESIWQLSSLRISLSIFLKSYTHIYRPIVPFQNCLKRCVFSKSFFWNFSLVIDYRILVIDYIFIFWRVMNFQSIFWSVVTGNQLQTSGNRLQDSKFKFQNPFESLLENLSSGNRLHYLVINYQCLDLLETMCLRQKLINQWYSFNKYSKALSFSWT